jgi:anti-sigma regulatory factor (Ser/Thr protein kinase)
LDDTVFVNELAQVPDLRARFVGALERSGIDGDELQGWTLVFTELVNNAIEHGCLRAGDVVSVQWETVDSEVSVSVRDPGPCELSVQDFDEATCDGFAETGRGAGLFLIRAFVDRVQVGPGPGGGTEIRVAKRRGAGGETGGGL